MSAVYDDERIVREHTGRSNLPQSVARAIRAITRQRPEDPRMWVLAARCLRHTRRVSWAYRCYRRAVRLDPYNPELAEETGMYGLGAFGSRRAPRWTTYLRAARIDPERRERIDAVLLQYARTLPAEISVLVAVASVFALMGGAAIARRGNGIDGPLPEGVAPLSPAVGIAAALAVLLVVLVLLGLLVRPLRFGSDIVRRAFAWPPRWLHALSLGAAAGGVILTLVAAGFAGRVDTFESLTPWVLLCYLVTAVLGFLGMPADFSLRALIDVVTKVGRS